MHEELEGQVVIAKFATTTQHGAMPGKTQTQQTEYYNLDIIISVGYRIKSKRGVAFRKWANSVLSEYIIKGYAINDQRLQQLGEVIRIMKRTQNELETKKVASVIYTRVLAVKMSILPWKKKQPTCFTLSPKIIASATGTNVLQQRFFYISSTRTVSYTMRMGTRE